MDFLKYFRRTKPKPVLSTKETYNFLVVAALQEELDEFYKTNWSSFKKKDGKMGGAYQVSFTHKKESVRVLTYTPNSMGMPMTAASVMNIISIHNPAYIFMIGTCACLKKEHALGDVIVPARVFSYESGKYESGKFKPDYLAHSTGDDLRKEAQHLISKGNGNNNYKVITDEDLCSGSAVIDDNDLAKTIIDRCGRKLAGFDMEAYSIACINTVLKGQKELIVIKSFSDYAHNKGETEVSGKKDIAKKNSAHFAYQLIKHLHDSKFGVRTKLPI